jgi:hypothetical protein
MCFKTKYIDRRKKCDETRPRCSRCVQGKDQCSWPGQSAQSNPAPSETQSGSRQSSSSENAHLVPRPFAGANSPHVSGYANSLDVNDPTLDVFMESLPLTNQGNTHLALAPYLDLGLITGSLLAYNTPELDFPLNASVNNCNGSSASRSSHSNPLLTGNIPTHITRLNPPLTRPYTYLDGDEDDTKEKLLEITRQTLNVILRNPNRPYLLEISDTCE